MDLSLPKETQQIDRVMESFAKRYEECNPGLFLSEGILDVVKCVTKALTLRDRSPIHPGVQLDDAPHRCVQQIQQAENDEGRLHQEHPITRRSA